jgi:hypothetical protein
MKRHQLLASNPPREYSADGRRQSNRTYRSYHAADGYQFGSLGSLGCMRWFQWEADGKVLWLAFSFPMWIYILHHGSSFASCCVHMLLDFELNQYWESLSSTQKQPQFLRTNHSRWVLLTVDARAALALPGMSLNRSINYSCAVADLLGME